MSLEHKIPVIPNAPKDVYNLTRCKLGKKLWAVRPTAEFDLNDPHFRETNFAYEPLHDKHLLGYFSKPANMKYLLSADLITEDMHVKCTLRDYNAYRQYLRKLYVDDIRRELRRANRLSVERGALRRANDQARQKAQKYDCIYLKICGIYQVYTHTCRNKFYLAVINYTFIYPTKRDLQAISFSKMYIQS